jgi:hypothetical protein
MAAASSRPRGSRDLLWVLAATAAVCAILLAWSVGTAPVLGDESYHFRRAIVYFEALWSAGRPVCDPAFPAEGASAMRFWDAAGWHMGLALLWKALGTPSFLAAEAYHLTYMLMLGVFSFLAGRELYGRAGGWWTWALAMTMPINLLLGTVFYLEIPVAAMAAAATYCLLRQRAVWFGVALAGMFYVKMPMAAVLAPPLLLAAFLMLGDTWGQRVVRTLAALAVAAVLFAPDMLWRYEHFGLPIMFREGLPPSQAQVLKSLPPLPPLQRSAISLSLSDPLVLVKTFGVTGVAAGLASIAWAVWLVGRAAALLLRRARSAGLTTALRTLPGGIPPEVLVAAIPLLFYIASFVLLLRIAYDVRYFHGSVLFCTLLAGGLLARAAPFAYAGRRRWLVRGAAAVLVLGMVGQLATAPAAIHQHRRLEPAVEAGFAWIRENVPPGSLILYPEFNIVPMTGRPMAWAACLPRHLFNMTEGQRMWFLYYLRIRYIAVHPARFVERAEPTIEPMGFPLPWARSLRNLPYMAQVYPERECEVGAPNFVIYRIDYDKVPPEWLAGPIYEGGPAVLESFPAPAAEGGGRR